MSDSDSADDGFDARLARKDAPSAIASSLCSSPLHDTLVARRERSGEANLAIDMRTGGYLAYGRPWHPTEPWTAERFVTQALAVIAARG